ncbi:methyltransferase domain-containing protein [Rhizobiaceae bacterium n13]|uniref:Methyltransferase domain-containing protein n=2 Tax=Ferirhizobium litorale TaxID=2927786 RepID=A0AAE3QKP0_9HYPH|nr:methyltransferase domain-containing protein [Fererhizobium litorale]MDI7864630.1 methyltransferase domain-containing protein [Fererhizobium litorale]MDI7924828.1 methyltransferase domain-containing protein [Fererhizobium litorale]
MGRWSQRLAMPFLEFAGVPSRGRVLDAGCGTGSLTLPLAAHQGLEAIDAVDFAEDFVAALRGRTNDPRIRARQGDVCALPYEAASFEAVYSLLVLHFVSDADRAIAEMHRVLRPGALAAATVWASGGMPSWRLFWDTVLLHEPTAEAIAPVRRPLTSAGELRMAFERAGFMHVVETRLTISMDYADFDDFWHPTAYGQGRFGAFFDALPEKNRDRLRDAVKAAYCAGEREGPRSFPSTALAVRCIA